MPTPRHCRRPSSTRNTSTSSAFCLPWTTSQRHCARKRRSSMAATNCGRPKRSRVKNRPMDRTRVFYHGGGGFGKSRMDDQDRPPDFGPPAPPLPVAEGSRGNVAQRPAQPLLHGIFLGPAGLRVPWRIVLYLLFAAVIFLVLSAIVNIWWP